MGLASDPLSYPWTDTELGAGAGTDLGQPGAPGSLVNQVLCFKVLESSLGEMLDLPGAELSPWCGDFRRSDLGRSVTATAQPGQGR